MHVLADESGCLDVMKKDASRMRILSIYDLSASESLRALRHLRRQALGLRQQVGYDQVGDRRRRRIEEGLRDEWWADKLSVTSCEGGGHAR